MLLGIGIDLLSLARLEGVIARRGASALAKRICSPREYTEFSSIEADQHLKYLSSRWCLKEAAYKALSAHIHPRWAGFDVLTLPQSAPVIRMTDHIVFRKGSDLARTRQGTDSPMSNATEGAGGVEMMCSLSNDAGMVVGVVVAMRKA